MQLAGYVSPVTNVKTFLPVIVVVILRINTVDNRLFMRLFTLFVNHLRGFTIFVNA